MVAATRLRVGERRSGGGVTGDGGGGGHGQESDGDDDGDGEEKG